MLDFCSTTEDLMYNRAEQNGECIYILSVLYHRIESRVR